MAIPPWRCSVLYHGKNDRQKTVAGSIPGNRPGNSGWYFSVLNCASENGLSSETCGRLSERVTPRSASSCAVHLLVIGAPLYNFGMPAALKAWVDQIVRMGRTVEYDETRPEDPFTPLLADRARHAVILSSRGGAGFNPGGDLAHLNHLEPGLTTVLQFIGITRIHYVAVEHQGEGGERLAASIRQAEHEVDALVEQLQSATSETPQADYALG